MAFRTTFPRVSFTLILTMMVWFFDVSGLGLNWTWSTTSRSFAGTVFASTDFSPFGRVIVPSEGLAWTTSVALEKASALPRLLRATTLSLTVRPASASTTEHPPLEVLDTPDTPTIETLVDLLRSKGHEVTAADTLKNVVVMLRYPDGRTEPLVVGTGGLAELFAPLCRSFDEVDPHLTLYGLSLAYALLAGD